MIGPVDLLLVVGLAGRLARLVVVDDAGAPVRRTVWMLAGGLGRLLPARRRAGLSAVVAGGLGCWWCVSVWTAAVAAGWWLVAAGTVWWTVPAVVGSASWLVGLTATVTDDGGV